MRAENPAKRIPCPLPYQKNLLRLQAMAERLGMRIVKDIDMFAFYTAAAVFGCVHHAVDHNSCTVGNYPGVDGNRVTGTGNGAGAGAAAPFSVAAGAGAVAGSAKTS